MILSTHERAQLRTIITMPQWQTVCRLAEILQQETRANIGARETEWETMRSVLYGDGVVNGIAQLIQRAQAEAQKGTDL